MNDEQIYRKQIRLAIAERLGWEEFNPSFFERLKGALGEYGFNIVTQSDGIDDEWKEIYKANPDPDKMHLDIEVEIDATVTSPLIYTKVIWSGGHFTVHGNDDWWRTGDLDNDGHQSELDDHIDELIEIIRFKLLPSYPTYNTPLFGGGRH